MIGQHHRGSQRPNGVVTFFHVNLGRIESSSRGNVLNFKNPWRGRNKYTLTKPEKTAEINAVVVFL